MEGEAYKTTNISGTFQLDMLADWGKANSVCEALWTAAETAPDTDISMTLTAASGAQFVFPVKPEFPTAGGSGIDAQTVSFTFTVSKSFIAYKEPLFRYLLLVYTEVVWNVLVGNSSLTFIPNLFTLSV